jgi:hypothetical protein
MPTSTLHHLSKCLATGGALEPRTAFVLSGGASLGALQVGMLEALHERAIAPDLLVASSVLGRRTYDSFAASRPSRGGEFADRFNSLRKYVVSSTLGSGFAGGERRDSNQRPPPRSAG